MSGSEATLPSASGTPDAIRAREIATPDLLKNVGAPLVYHAAAGDVISFRRVPWEDRDGHGSRLPQVVTWRMCSCCTVGAPTPTAPQRPTSARARRPRSGSSTSTRTAVRRGRVRPAGRRDRRARHLAAAVVQKRLRRRTDGGP